MSHDESILLTVITIGVVIAVATYFITKKKPTTPADTTPPTLRDPPPKDGTP